MKSNLRSTLLLTPRPVEARDVRVTRDGPVWRCCWVLGGLTSVTFGPGFANVAQAAAAARLVRGAHGL